MRTVTILTLAFGCALALAGCLGGSPTTPTPTPTPTVSTPTASTPTATPTPTPGLTASVTKVTVVSAPDRAASGSSVDVCYRVEGSGHIPHVAVHWDTVSHPSSTNFGDYKGGAVYPNGKTVADPLGYNLPAVFCVKLPAGSGTVYYRAHALNPTATPAQSVLSDERTLWSGAAPHGLDFLGDVPEVAPAKSNVTLCWQDDAVGTIPHTAIHWDTTSHPSSTAFGDYKGGAIYPDNATAAAIGGYATPGHFCSSLAMPESGVVYFRAHELNPPASLNNVSAEKSIVVAPAVSIVSAPASAAAGSKVLVCWRVETEGGASHVPHTAVHWDTTSHPTSTAFGDYKGGATYPANGTAAAASGYDLPGPFCSTITMPNGPLYFRAHVLLPGVRNEVSNEVAVQKSG